MLGGGGGVLGFWGSGYLGFREVLGTVYEFNAEFEVHVTWRLVAGIVAGSRGGIRACDSREGFAHASARICNVSYGGFGKQGTLI